MNKWITYNLIVGFSVYWMSNLILWFPWSVNPLLGMTLMLTVSPVIWAISSYLCLRTSPKENMMIGATYNSISFLVLAVIMDYVFFGIIRDAMEQLYHPTTFYGYAFVASLPFMATFALKKKLERAKRAVSKADFLKAIIIGSTCFALLTLIIIFDIGL